MKYWLFIFISFSLLSAAGSNSQDYVAHLAQSPFRFSPSCPSKGCSTTNPFCVLYREIQEQKAPQKKLDLTLLELVQFFLEFHTDQEGYTWGEKGCKIVPHAFIKAAFSETAKLLDLITEIDLPLKKTRHEPTLLQVASRELSQSHAGTYERFEYAKWPLRDQFLVSIIHTLIEKGANIDAPPAGNESRYFSNYFTYRTPRSYLSKEPLKKKFKRQLSPKKIIDPEPYSSHYPGNNFCLKYLAPNT